ncbi:MAG: M28 family peptidase [Desulfurococcaceae archaeon]
MNGLRGLLERYSGVPLTLEARDLLRKITLYHRIQGSSGLEEATKEIAESFETMGFKTTLFEVPSSSKRGFMETPVSWNARDGFVELRIGGSQLAKFNYHDHPTLIAAHSPPSEGCGELKYCKEVSGCDGEVVLVEAPGYIAYREIPARLIILYDSKRHSEAVPYTGLFIKEGEIKNTSVVNVPYTTALKAISLLGRNEKLEVCWKVDTEYMSKPMYGLLAYSGEDPGVLYISHICHPKPGAHDNASGVVANVLTAKLLRRSPEKISHAHLFVPEYSGTVYVHEYLPWMPVAAVNLDMVGSKQWITNSTLNIVNAPLFARSVSPAYAYIATKLVLDEASSFGGFKLPASRYSLAPYTAGSDHDVTTLWGIDSVMLNEWPSKYYHTDMDDADTISPSQLVNKAVISALVGSAIAGNHGKGSIESAFKDFVKSWYAIESLKAGIDVSRVSGVLENQVELSVNFEYTPLSSRYLYGKLGVAAFLKLRNVKGAYSFISVYAPLAYLNGVNNFFELFQLENLLQWSSEERRLLEEAWLKVEEDIG